MFHRTPLFKRFFSIYFLAFFVIILLGFIYLRPIGLMYQTLRCDFTYSNLLERGDCWDTIVTKHFHSNGLEDAFYTLRWIYEHESDYVKTNCHRHAHVIGDLAYHYLYAPNGNFNKIPIMEEQEACGFGFFAGLFEHIIQNHPDPVYAVSLCDKFISENLNKIGGGIEHICYHSVAHGLLLARADMLPKSAWGNANLFISDAIHACNILPTKKKNQESCKHGVFHQLYLWMHEKSYGFSDEENPLTYCNGLPDSWRKSCYYNAGQGYSYNLTPDESWNTIKKEKLGEDFTKIVFDVGVGNMLMPTINTPSALKSLVLSCVSLPTNVADECIRALVYGIYLYGTPLKEYETALKLCFSQEVMGTSMEKACFEAMVSRNKVNYTPIKGEQICSMFPNNFYSLCHTKIESVKD